MLRLLVPILLMACGLSSLLAKNKQEKCEGTYTYIFSTGMSVDEAKVKALDMAISRAIADKFGTTINSESYLEISNSKESFNHISRLIVKGKWVKDIHAPKFSNPVFANNIGSIDVTVSFYAQPLEVAPVSFTSHVLRNGTEDRFESYTFHGSEDEKIYVSFQSPKAGYLAIFLEDTENVFCALPYIGNEEAPFYVKKDKRYVFFNVDNNRYHITPTDKPEINFVHVIFSSHKFIDGDLIREMSREKFRKWLGNAQSYDEKMQVKSEMIKIIPKK